MELKDTSYASLKVLLNSNNYIFHSSGSLMSKTKEGHAKSTSASSYLKKALPTVGYAVYTLYASSAIFIFAHRALRSESGFLLVLLAGPVLKIFDCVAAAGVPISHNLDFQKVPARRDWLSKTSRGSLWPRQIESLPRNGPSLAKVGDMLMLILIWCK